MDGRAEPGPRALVADVGGTNSRLALAEGGEVIAGTVRRFANDDYPDFSALARAYLDGHGVAALAVAIAGPVTTSAGRLTNRDWHFETAALAAALDIPQVRLLNDLAALGLALPILPAAAMEELRGPGAAPGKNPQALVVGLGTGFNVSLVSMHSGEVFEAELGHASLPATVIDILAGAIDTGPFTTVETLFCGQGLSRLHAALGNGQASPVDIAATGTATLALMARALGTFARELAYLYLPDAGLYFNGSIARLLLTCDHRAAALDPLAADTAFQGRIARIPAYMITEDSAALHGCARVVDTVTS